LSGVYFCTLCKSAQRLARSTDKLEALGEAVAIVDFARAETQRRAPHLTHPLLCLDAIRFGVEHGGRAGLRKVRHGCAQVRLLPLPA
jgi:hypothetical protein